MVFGATQKKAELPIGSMIRFRRNELGLTLSQLAEKSELSAPFISQAERNLTVPSLVSLMKLAKALEVEISYFMEIPTGNSVVNRASELKPIEIESPVKYFQLGGAMPEQQMDAILMKIPPGHQFPIDQRDGEDFLYVLSGILHAEAGDVHTDLGAGDSMHFDSRLSHSAKNNTDEEVVLLYVGTPSIFKV